MGKFKKIDGTSIEDIIALTPLQEGMLFHYLKDPQNESYFEQLSLEIPGEIDVDIFEKAWNFVVETNEMLRTVFRWEKLEKTAQVVLKQHNPDLRFLDLSTIDDHLKRQNQLEKIKLEDRKEKFDLREVPFRVILCKFSGKHYHIIISNHHILYDGWSSGIILKEFFRAYDVLEKGETVPMPEIKPPFKEFIKWHQNRDKDKQKKFWEEYLKGFDNQTGLTIERKGLKGNSGEAAVKVSRFVLEKGITSKLDIFLKEKRVTLAAFFYCAWGILLQKYCGSEDVVFGTTVSGRSAPIKGIENMVGLFINTLPLRVTTKCGESLLDLLLKVNDILPHREKYEHTPLVDIREHTRMETGQELFDSLLVMENYPLDRCLMEENYPLSLTVQSYSIIETTTFDLTIGILIGDEIEISFNYNNVLFENPSIRGLSQHFTNIIKRILREPGSEIFGLEILSEEEKNRVLYDLNNTAVKYPKDKKIHQLFEEQTKKIPDNIALIMADKELTYRELNKKANQLAHLLQSKGFEANAIVGLMVDRSLEMIVGILGILKSGGAYLPIDPEYPGERIEYILNDSASKILVTTQDLSREIEFAYNIILLADAINHFPTHPHLPLSPTPATSLAYVIYTSGSTGKPKGVLVEHYSVVNLAYSQKDQYKINETDRILQFSSICFDASVEQIFIALSGGAGLVLIDRDTLLDASQFEAFIASRSITHLNAIPSFLSNMGLKEIYNLKRIISGGDVCHVALAKRWSRYCDFYNAYGPTETTVTCIKLRVEDIDESFPRLPVGRPLNNTLVYLFDKWMKSVPIGVIGELYIGGDGVARGYLNRPELTSEKFDQDLRDLQDYHDEEKKVTIKKYNKKLLRGVQGGSFLEKRPPGRRRQRTYKTGDLARWLQDGNLEFLGRIDNQVKIRGFRIEVGEIENQLLKHEAIKEAVVLAKDDERGDKYLAAYIVSGDISLPGLREYLLKVLPGYMVPSYFKQLDEIPLTPTGKIHHRALPEPEKKTGETYVAPKDEIERKLVDLWTELLNLRAVDPPVGIDNNFFALGGHSLKATTLVSRIHKVFNVRLSLAQVFKRPTIRGQVGYIRSADEDRYRSIEAIEKREYYWLSSAQKRLYFLYQMQVDEAITVYNMSSAWILEGILDKDRLEQVFRKLIQRHESLRTSFEKVGEEPVQRVHGETVIGHWSLVIGETDQSEIKDIIKNFVKPFDLSQAPLLRVELIKLLHTPTVLCGHPSQEGKEDKYLLLVDMHHIISDGMSMELLVQDFIALYSDEALPVMRYQYKDYGEWQNRRKESKKYQEQTRFWQEEFKAEIPVLELPIDYIRSAVQRFEGSSLGFELDKPHTDALNALALGEGATLYMVLLAIYTIFLSKISNQEDIVIGTPTAGRRHADLEKIIGMFVNTLALRNYPSGEKEFITFLAEVKEKTLKAFENQDYQYEELVELVSVKRDASRNPLFDTMFALQNADVTTIEIPGMKMKPYQYERETAKFDLTLECTEHEENLSFLFEYNKILFKQETIQRLTGYFKQLISTVVERPAEKISGIEIISREEIEQVLFQFNETGIEYPKEKSLHQLFREQVEKAPFGQAVNAFGENLVTNFEDMEGLERKKRENISLTYKELNKRSDQLAYSLKDKGVRLGDIVGIKVERSVEMIVGILGILKTGAAYLPISPDYPEERIRYMLNDSHTNILLTAKEILSIPSSVSPVSSVAKLPSQALIDGPKGTTLAYVMYTSGSTGNPKGVPITHTNLYPLLHWGYKRLGLGPKDRVLQNLSYYFDWSVWEIFIALTTGAALYIVPGEALLNPEVCLSFMVEKDITVLHATPSQYEHLIKGNENGQKMGTLKYLFLGAERLSVDLLKRSFERVKVDCRVFNMYGPTEATIISVVLEAYRGEENRFEVLTGVPIGKPVGKTVLLVLDSYMKLCPPNIIGELYIAGDGVAQGYLNNPELTAERFFDKALSSLLLALRRTERAKNPLRGRNQPAAFLEIPGVRSQELSPKPHTLRAKSQEPRAKHTLRANTQELRAKLYKTGDLTRWLGDGNMEFLGRIDHQVKIRGFRIEMGEIENQLLTHKKVREAILIAREGSSSDKYLCAYIVVNKEETTPYEPLELREYLANRLPGYMLPTYFVQLDQIPLTPNGKINRKALPDPGIDTISANYVPPRYEIEMKLVKIWSELLGIEENRISINDNFFHLGGHSLKATLLVSKIHKIFDVTLPLAEIFTKPSIRKLAVYIKDAAKSRNISIKPVEEKEYYPTSSVQKRFWTHCQLEGASLAYNIPAAFHLNGDLKPSNLIRIWQTLVQRHESLRTVFITVKDEPVQRVLSPHQVNSNLEFFELEDIPTTEKDRRCRQLATQETHTPFDLFKGPLVRAKLLHLGGQDFFLLITLHHIISDGWSLEILMRELLILSRRFSGEKAENCLVPLRIQYRDYVVWQASQFQLERVLLKEHENFWLNHLSGSLPRLLLPGLERPKQMTFSGDQVNILLDRGVTEGLRALGEAHDATLFMVMIAVFNILFYKYTSQTDIILGTPSAGRDLPDLEDQVGLFLNTLVLRTRFSAGDSVVNLLNKVISVVSSSMAHQVYPFDRLVEQLAAVRVPNRHPIFDVMINMIAYTTVFRPEPGDTFHMQPVETDYAHSKFDLCVYINETPDSLALTFEYNIDIFDKKQISVMAEVMRQLTARILKDPTMSILDVCQDPCLEFAPLEAASDSGSFFQASYHQERLWFIDKFEAGYLYEKSPVYHNIPLILEISGEVDKNRLERAIQAVILEHSVLRTRLITHANDNTLLQCIDSTTSFKLQGVELNPGDDAISRAVALSREPFQPDKEHLVRGYFIAIGQEESLLLVTFHHLAADHFSTGLFTRQVFAHYQGGEVSSVESSLRDSPLQYVDFSQWQRQIPDEQMELLFLYWKRQLQGNLAPLEMPTYHPRAPVHVYQDASQYFELFPGLSERVKRFSRQSRISPFILLLTTFKVLLHRYCGQEEIVVGTVDPNRYNRNPAGVEEIIGPIANLLVLRSFLSGERSFQAVCSCVGQTVEQAFRNGHMPFDYLVTRLAPAKDMSRTALFDVLFQYEDNPFTGYYGEGLSARVKETNLGWGKYDLDMLIQNREGQFSGVLVFNGKYYDEWQISRMIDHYCLLLQGLLEEPSIKLAKVSLLTPGEKEKLLEEWSGPNRASGFPRGVSINWFFENQVTQKPFFIALSYKNHAISLGELDRKANQLVLPLREKGIGPDVIAAVMMVPSLEMIIGLLGVLKAGGAYLPIDPNYPEDRINYMLADSGARVLLAAPDTQVKELPSILTLASTSGGAASAAHLAYVIYTSGTTGRPKGVMVTHENVVRLFFNNQFQFDFAPGEVWTLFHSFCFDFSVWEMYGALLLGGKLVIFPRMEAKDIGHYLQLLKKEGVTVLNQTPSAFYHLMEKELEQVEQQLTLKYVIFGGEELNPTKLKDWQQKYPKTLLINMYGITETTVHVTYKEITAVEIAAGVSNIGTPIPTLTIYIMDMYQQPVPVGVTGEICVGGAGVSRGYLNRPDLTAAKFVINPGKPGEGLYRSGDLGRFLSNGDIQYQGRLDHQVKIRGFRIELAEIEKQLLKHDCIREAVVVDRKIGSGQGEKYLCAYVVSTGDIEVGNLRTFLARALPDYMIPGAIVRIESFPLTTSGKIHRAALPEPVLERSQKYRAPRSDIEKKLAVIWSEVLHIPLTSIGLDDDFFEQGGHSLRAAQLAAKVRKAFDVTLSLSEVFTTPSISGLAACIKESVKELYFPMESVEQKEYYPLSSSQRRLHVLQQMDEEAVGYNMPAMWIVEGDINPKRFGDAFFKVIRHHESLRTSFHVVNDEAVQKVHDETVIGHWSLVIGEADKKEIKDIIKNFVKPFDLSQAPLLRVELIKLLHTPTALRAYPSQEKKEDKYLLMVDMHHIIADGISVNVFIKEFMVIYGGKKLPPLIIQYKDFSEWQRHKKQKETIRKQEVYWLEQWADEKSVLNLATDYPRPSFQSFAGNTLPFELDEKESRALKFLAREQSVTLFMLLLSLYTIFLSKLSGQEDIAVGIPTAGRRYADLENIMGMFVNTLALRNFPTGQRPFSLFLEEVKTRTLEAFENQDYPFEDLVEQVNVERDTSRNPLFDTMFVLQNIDTPVIEIPGLKLAPFHYEIGISKFDLTLTAVEAGEKLLFIFEYSTALFKEETIERFIRYFKNVHAAVIENKAIKLEKIEIITGEETRQLIIDFNDTAEECPTQKTIYQLFQARVDETPDHVALVFKDEALTFRQFDERANQLANYLTGEKCIRPGDRIAVLMDRSVELIVTLMGVMKARVAYVPLDVSLPGERLRVVFNDASIGVVVSRQKYLQKLTMVKSGCKGLSSILSMDGIGKELNRYPSSRPEIGDADDPAYVMYTSGSSGTPKGVLVEHRTIVNTLDWRRRFYEYGPGNVSLQVPPYFFDSSVTDIFTPLLGGARLVLVSEEERFDLVVLKELITGNKVSHFIVVPAFYNVLLEEIADYLKSVKMITCAGEHFPDELIRKHFEKLPGVRIFNEYGPTENSVNSTVFELEAHSPKALIGKPISNVRVYILDRYLRLIPIGVIGEICLSGSSLARGYLNRPELTAEKFVINSNIRFYRTGDMGKWLSDGNLEFLGRIDTQVKIRGVRVETGEIENHLMRHEDIKEAVVLAHKGTDGKKYLCAYVVLANVKPDADADLKLYLSGKLPEYMIPSHFIVLDAIPFTPTGKINREAFPEPRLCTKGRIAPRNQVEERLAKIWADILDIQTDTIGSDSDFFQLGGHSLKATIAASRIHKAFNVKVPLAEIFTHPTLRVMAKYIGRARQERFAAIEPVEKKEYYPLSQAQKRLHLLQQMDLNNIAYNMPMFITLTKSPGKERLESAFKKLIERHESLSTSFEMTAEEPVQRVHEEVEFEIEYYDSQVIDTGDRCRWEEEPFGQINALGEEPGTHHSSKNRIIHHSFIRPFDLSSPPLLRVGLIQERGSGGNCTLMVDMHHIITDGASHAVLKDEFNMLYTGKVQDLPLLRLQYKDYAQWQNRERQSEVIKRQETYWLKEFNGEVPVLQLPTDYPRPFMQSFAGRTVEFTLSPQESQTLKSLAKKTNATLYMSLLAAFNILLSKLSGQEDIIVGTPIMGRRHTDLERIIGIFVNTLAMRNQPSGEKGFKDFLSHVKERTLSAYENQEYQFEDLVDKINVVRDIGRNPLFDVMFNLLNIEEYTYTDDFPGSAQEETCQFTHRKGTSKFDLTLTAVDLGERLLFTFEYCTKLFEPNTIDRFISYFKRILASLSEDSARRVSEMDIITETEKHQLLYEFNDTNAQYPEDMTIRRWFEEQVTGTPDHVALIGTAPGARSTEGEKHIHLTYKELNRKSNRLAEVFRCKGVKTGSIVGLMVNRSIQMMVGLLAILKAGAAYLPIDSKHPRQRLEYMLRDSDSRVILTDKEEVPVIPTLVKIDPYDLDKYKAKSSPPCAAGYPTDLAYTIYTSGTTGKPKGVMIENRSLVNFIKGITDVVPFQESDSILSLTTISFDIFGLETILPLTKGSKVVIGTEEEQLDAGSAAKVMENENISIFQTTPSRLQLFIMNSKAAKRLRRLKYLLVGGEVLPDILLKKLGKLTEGKIYNVYGPTETTIWSTLKDVSAGKSLNIGKPISNTYIYILSRSGSLQPLGVGGELSISGDGLARGYLNRPELTSERFRRVAISHSSLVIGSPLKTNDNPSNLFTNDQWPMTNDRLYPTGDLALWLEDGNIEFLGRMDFQVKIRGFRIELGEIENCLKTHPGIKDTIVIDRNDNERQYLCAYVTAAPIPGKGIPSIHELKEHLEGKLPGYMIPACFVSIESIPLTPSGKVDRNRLPQPLESDFHTQQTYEAPVSSIQRIIAEIWQEVLGREKVGTQDNFFDLGGNSLDFIKISNKLKEKLELEIPVVTLFTYPTIRSLELHLTRERGVEEDDPGLIDEGKDIMQLTLKKLDNGD